MNFEKQVEKLQSGKRKSKLRALVQLGTLGAKASAAVVIVENLLTTDGDEPIASTTNGAVWNRQANEWEIHITNEYLGDIDVSTRSQIIAHNE